MNIFKHGKITSDTITLYKFTQNYKLMDKNLISSDPIKYDKLMSQVN